MGRKGPPKNETIQEWTQRMKDRGMIRREGECNVWVGHKDKRGVPTVRDGGKWPRPARLVAWLKAGKTVSAGSVVVNACGTPGCVRPSHCAVRSRKEVGRVLGQLPKERGAGGRFAGTTPEVG